MIIDPHTAVIAFAKDHYENFPVISLLIPKDLQKHVAAIYWFARTADDIADEGSDTQNKRLEDLDILEQRLDSALAADFHDDYFQALSASIIEKRLNPVHFRDLLQAFRQDVLKKRYNNYSEVLEYCALSANPVGRLMLELFNVRDESALLYSDKICTALQITNFLQDVKTDYLKRRVYLPQDELAYFGVDEEVFEMSQINSNFKELMKFNVERTLKLFNEGKPLLDHLKGRFRIEIKWTIAGGIEVLNKIKKIDYNVLQVRPYLTKKDFFKLFMKSLI